MTRQTSLRSTLILRLATLAVTAGLVAGVAGMTAGSPASAPSVVGLPVAAAATTPAVVATPTAPARPVASPSDPTATPTPSRKVARSGQSSSAVTTAKAAVRPATARRTIYIRNYLDRMGSQAAVDTGKLVLWWDKPYWLAGHNYRGWQWLAFVPTGAKVVVTDGRATGTYIVLGHRRLNRQSGPMPEVRADLVLQTCVGDQTGLTLLKRALR
jgi:hypothetical protein